MVIMKGRDSMEAKIGNMPYRINGGRLQNVIEVQEETSPGPAPFQSRQLEDWRVERSWKIRWVIL